ncbi:hypothetical protein SAMN04488101_101737 [Pedobacter nyackensis]|uniref:Uncharacterized protein n=1 Tax=Pedobacter nyackensis TaxID=475255 RepID=A0A1W2AMF0_9SPHI|nr:hypothetical protein SAMN04488101_101737 [Pedobacter nyackensis]
MESLKLVCAAKIGKIITQNMKEEEDETYHKPNFIHVQGVYL